MKARHGHGVRMGPLRAGRWRRQRQLRSGVVKSATVVRERPKIGRIVCAWSIWRFIDPLAEFVCVPTRVGHLSNALRKRRGHILARRRALMEDTMGHILVLLVIFGLTLAAGGARAEEIDWKKVDAALGKTGAVQAGGIHRYGLPRSDLNVAVDGVAIKPALALGGWVAFEPTHDGAMVMGDVVLTETEIEPVMTKLLEGGLEITALHNHLLRANPPTYYMHVGGHGDPVKMAGAIRAALALSKTPFEAAAASPPPAPSVDLPTAQLDE